MSRVERSWESVTTGKKIFDSGQVRVEVFEELQGGQCAWSKQWEGQEEVQFYD